MALNPFAKSSNPHLLEVGMVGTKMGERFVQIGCAHGGRLGAVAAKVGLSGRAVALVPDEASAARAQKGAAQAGVLIEVEVAPMTALPVDAGAFDVAVVDDTGGLVAAIPPDDRARLVGELFRILRPAGRAMVIGAVPDGLGALGALFRRPSSEPSFAASGALHELLATGGFRPVRTLAERDGLIFVEALKPRCGNRQRHARDGTGCIGGRSSRPEDSQPSPKSVKPAAVSGLRRKTPPNIGKAFASATASLAMSNVSRASGQHYSPREIAQAAGVPESQVLTALGGVSGYVSHEERSANRANTHCGRRIARRRLMRPSSRSFQAHTTRYGRPAVPLALSSTLHAGYLRGGRLHGHVGAHTCRCDGCTRATRADAAHLRRTPRSGRRRWRRRLAAESTAAEGRA